MAKKLKKRAAPKKRKALKKRKAVKKHVKKHAKKRAVKKRKHTTVGRRKRKYYTSVKVNPHYTGAVKHRKKKAVKKRKAHKKGTVIGALKSVFK